MSSRLREHTIQGLKGEADCYTCGCGLFSGDTIYLDFSGRTYCRPSCYPDHKETPNGNLEPPNEAEGTDVR